jgi:hypothetical protein
MTFAAEMQALPATAIRFVSHISNRKVSDTPSVEENSAPLQPKGAARAALSYKGTANCNGAESYSFEAGWEARAPES